MVLCFEPGWELIVCPFFLDPVAKTSHREWYATVAGPAQTGEATCLSASARAVLAAPPLRTSHWAPSCSPVMASFSMSLSSGDPPALRPREVWSLVNASESRHIPSEGEVRVPAGSPNQRCLSLCPPPGKGRETALNLRAGAVAAASARTQLNCCPLSHFSETRWPPS